MGYRKKIIHFFVLSFLLISPSSYAQQILIFGKVTDTLENPLAYANILAIPKSETENVRFASTQDNGTYKLGLSKNQSYEVTVSYLGYKTQTINITSKTQNINKNFLLSEALNKLDVITLNYTPPVIVKKDTITYDVSRFVTGEERKLRDALKKLPGVEVDRVGNVTVQGKKVTKVLVEDKMFFTGDSKLAVNNIPADAVDKIEVLDNYNDVAMLKGLEDNEDMAMNIKLKANKKKFVFGDIEAGAGIEDIYVLHPNIFFYSPKTNVNFIGDLNNQGVKSFSFRDYLEFEGGFGKLMRDASSYFSLFKSDFARYLNNQDYTANTNQFGALNIRQALNNYTDLSGYIISSKSKTQTNSNTLNKYLSTTNPFVEDRTVSDNFDNYFTIAKLTLDYRPSYNEDFTYNSFVKVTTNISNGLITTINPSDNNTINTLTNIKGLNVKQHISYSRKLSKKHTATLEATYNFQNDKPITEWLTNNQILQGLIPLEDDDIYNIIQTKKSKAHTFNAIIKDYWVLNNFNHLYTSMGLNAAFNDFYNEDLQKLSNGAINNFSTANFGNDFGYDFIDTFLGLEYKFQIGIATFKPMLYYHFYNWNTKQFDDKFSNYKALLLPQFTTKIEFSNTEILNFKYKLNASFPDAQRLANNFILNNFNSVFKGNTSLENQLYHSASLNYYKFSLFKNLNIHTGVSFNKKIKHFKNITVLNGINQFSTPVLFDEPEDNWSVNGSVAKKINKIRYKLKSNFSYSDFFQILNNSINKNISKSISATISAETFFKNYPNIEIGYTKDYSSYRAFNSMSKFENNRFFINLEYDFLTDFIFKADYSFDNYKNKNSRVNTAFDTANASLFYQNENNPWGFEIQATNLFNIKFKQQNSFNSFLISDSKTFVLPRIIMFKIIYKL